MTIIFEIFQFLFTFREEYSPYNWHECN
jgi:hypothetical protein